MRNTAKTIAPGKTRDVRSGDLRNRLREDLSSAHARLDATLSRFDLSDEDDFARFLAVHYVGFSVLIRDVSAEPAATGCDVRPLLQELRDSLAADLGVLGASLPNIPPAPPAGLSADAVAYVTLGSRLGSQVLSRDWRLRARGRTALAGRYMGLPPCSGEWRIFCQAAQAIPAQGPQSDRVVADAARIFALFSTAMSAISQPPLTMPLAVLRGDAAIGQPEA